MTYGSYGSACPGMKWNLSQRFHTEL
jgi:hypothetical protein